MELYWLWLSEQKGIGPVTLRKLVRVFGSPQGVYEASPRDLEISGLRSGLARSFALNRSLERANQIEEAMKRQNVRLLTFMDPAYPQHLNTVSNLPALLYYKGIVIDTRESVGIVGSRRCTSYGKQVAAEASAYLAGAGVTVVSGMAKGIDSYAHTACLKNDGYTLALVANGPDICYPPENTSLMEEIIKRGAVVSPYPPGTRPRQEYFPLRNRLLAAWVDKLLVVEAAERSGALITANYAVQRKRRVFAVPNSIYSPESMGTNRLLLEGAEVYLEPAQLVNSGMPTVKGTVTESQTQVNRQEAAAISSHRRDEEPPSKERMILGKLNEPKAIVEFLELFSGDLSALMLFLCQMELEGKIKIAGDRVERE
ncbi:hypothetical protein CEB3_c31400 [Peptococcaceae bacterium CEB3]|nr:hypothetical protein CEB3_c31400 [Peptococcaceae bacterium CEB3]